MIEADDDPRRRAVPFLAYLIVGAVNVIAHVLGWHEVAVASKALLLPVLAIGAVASARRSRVPGRLLGVLLIALTLSWLGDIALELPGETWFVVGLGGFLLSHVAYLVLLAGVLRVGRPPLPALIVYAAWLVVLLAILWPHLGGLVAAVVAYGAVLTAMAAFAAAGGRLLAWGGGLFVISDSVLALGRFVPGFELPLQDALIMATYIAAQGLIAAGALAAGRRGAADGRRRAAAGESSDAS